jgi:hypothetical protein
VIAIELQGRKALIFFGHSGTGSMIQARAQRGENPRAPGRLICGNQVREDNETMAELPII